MSTPKAAPRGLFGLPPELRHEIFQYVLVKPTAMITMVYNQDCKSEVSAAQPPLCYVNKQIRSEALPIFYRSNTFGAELAHEMDIETAENWFAAIGEGSIGNLRRVLFSCWTLSRLDGGWCRYVARCAVNPKTGMLEVVVKKPMSTTEGGAETLLDDDERMVRLIEEGVAGYGCADMGGEALGKLMMRFFELVKDH